MIPFARSGRTRVLRQDGLNRRASTEGSSGTGPIDNGAQAEGLCLLQAGGTVVVLRVGEDETVFDGGMRLQDVARRLPTMNDREAVEVLVEP